MSLTNLNHDVSLVTDGVIRTGVSVAGGAQVSTLTCGTVIYLPDITNMMALLVAGLAVACTHTSSFMQHLKHMSSITMDS